MSEKMRGGGSERVGARAIRVLVSAPKIRRLSSPQNIKNSDAPKIPYFSRASSRPKICISPIFLV